MDPNSLLSLAIRSDQASAAISILVSDLDFWTPLTLSGLPEAWLAGYVDLIAEINFICLLCVIMDHRDDIVKS